jgi:hypothetical protein
MAARYPRNRAASRNKSDRKPAGTIVASGIIVMSGAPVTLIYINAPQPVLRIMVLSSATALS